MDYYKKYYQNNKHKYKKGGKYYKYKSRYNNNDKLIITHGKFIIFFD